MPRFLSPRFLLPAIVMVGVMVVFLRVGTLWDTVTTGKFAVTTAHAESKDAPAVTPPPKDAAKEPAKDAAPAAKTEAAPVADTAPAIEAPRYSVDDLDRSAAEVEVLNQLVQRRESLEKRSKELDARDALIGIAEQRVDQKIKEMNTLRQQLQSMVAQAGETQAAQIDNLVKIYETMKPEEAARILETLDMPVLLGVIQRMKPARTAPVMAKMAPDKAKEITIALTKQDQLPQIK